ncbi:MAG: hypothetical protein NW241_11850 [Bacteroidia bacterium]|nr:hypothetical protein [Bacteroidia bacterium]
MNKRIGILAFTAVAGMFALTGCNPEACKDVDCGTYGSCLDVDLDGTGDCICETGYEQNADGKCNDRVTAKFVGSYNAVEQCTNTVTGGTFTFNYTVDIEQSGPVVSRIILEGLGDLACDNSASPAKAEINATVAGSSLSIDAANYCKDNFPANIQFSGYQFQQTNGTISADRNTITLNYKVTWTELDGSTTVNYGYDCNVTLTRK